MAVPSVVLDGSAPYGSRNVTINAVGYIADDIQIARPSTKAEDRTITGSPNRARWTKERSTGTATLQAPSGSSGRPKFGDTFTMTVDDNYGSETWVVTEVPYSESNEPGEIRKMPITFELAIGAITTVA